MITKIFPKIKFSHSRKYALWFFIAVCVILIGLFLLINVKTTGQSIGVGPVTGGIDRIGGGSTTGSIDTIKDTVDKTMEQKLSILEKTKPYLLAHYKFEDTLKDENGVYDAWSVSSPGKYVDGGIGKAFSFSGASYSWIELPKGILDGRIDFTVTMWTKTSLNNGPMTLLSGAKFFSKEPARKPNEFFIKNPRKLGLYFKNKAYSPMTDLLSDDWHQLTITRKVSQLNVFVDGQKVWEEDVGNLPLIIDRMILGANLQVRSLQIFMENNPYVGFVDELRFYNYALSASDIQQIYIEEKAILVPEDCSNGIDDNANGLLDCQERTCYGHLACRVPIAHYSFEGDVDDSNSIYDGTSDNTAFIEDGIGQSVFFDKEKKSIVNLPAELFDKLEDFSVAFWVKTEQAEGSIISLAGGRQDKEFYVGNPASFRMGFGDSEWNRGHGYQYDTRIKSYNDLTLHDGRWNHVVITRSLGDIEIYKDGGLIVEDTFVKTTPLGVEHATLGRSWKGVTEHGFTLRDDSFSGNLDEFKVYGFKLTAVEVVGIYEEEISKVKDNAATLDLLMGDVDCSGKVDINDAILVARYSLRFPGVTINDDCSEG